MNTAISTCMSGKTHQNLYYVHFVCGDVNKTAIYNYFLNVNKPKLYVLLAVQFV